MRTTAQKAGLFAVWAFGCVAAAAVFIPTAATFKHIAEIEAKQEQLEFDIGVSRCNITEIRNVTVWAADTYTRIKTACTEREQEKHTFVYQANELWQGFKACFVYLFN